MRGLIAALLLSATPAMADRCVLACDEATTGAEALPRIERWLGASLPEGTRVENLLEGGFQDGFIRARLDADSEGFAAVLAAVGLSKAALVPVVPPAVSDDVPEWWDWKLRDGVMTGEGTLPEMPYATLYAAPSTDVQGRWTLYLWAFQT